MSISKEVAAQVPDSFGAGLSQVALNPTQGSAIDGNFLALGRDGMWSHGQEHAPLAEDDIVAINPLTCQVGWVIWGPDGDKGKKGEVMQSVAAGRCPKPEPHESGYEWKEQKGFKAKVMSGPDEGTDLIYHTTSVGGLRAVEGYFDKLLAQHQEGKPMVALMTLSQSPYQHPQWGKIYNPIFEIYDWLEIGVTELPKKAAPRKRPAAKKKPAAKAAPKARTRRRKA